MAEPQRGIRRKGLNTNQAESSFSLARRSEIGVYHRLSRTWLDFYAGEMCWREDRRRMGNLGIPPVKAASRVELI
jgi:hypothetical protein